MSNEESTRSEEKYNAESEQKWKKEGQMHKISERKWREPWQGTKIMFCGGGTQFKSLCLLPIFHKRSFTNNNNWGTSTSFNLIFFKNPGGRQNAAHEEEGAEGKRTDKKNAREARKLKLKKRLKRK
jgi:hypothetical protein